MNQAVKDKFSELVLSFLLTLQGAFKSWTMWINGVILGLPWLLDNFNMLQPILQAVLPENYYMKLLFWLPVINMGLRIKTGMSLAAKAAKPTSVGDSLRSIIPVLVVGLAVLLATPMAHAQVADPVRRFKDGDIYRSSAQVARFKTLYPCPANGARTGSCPGYVVDHKWPLFCARAEQERVLFDVPTNMQWLTTLDAKIKDKTEGASCRAPKVPK